jgi:hypothetical protein
MCHRHSANTTMVREALLVMQAGFNTATSVSLCRPREHQPTFTEASYLVEYCRDCLRKATSPSGVRALQDPSSWDVVVGGYINMWETTAVALVQHTARFRCTMHYNAQNLPTPSLPTVSNQSNQPSQLPPANTHLFHYQILHRNHHRTASQQKWPAGAIGCISDGCYLQKLAV